MSTTETHLAGPAITVDGRYMRQRCSWCGAVLLDYDLANVGVPEGQDGPSGWALDAMIRQSDHGAVSYVVEPERSATGDGVKLPDDSCMRIDPEVTR